MAGFDISSNWQSDFDSKILNEMYLMLEAKLDTPTHELLF
jgi:hypothetical protein